MAKNPVTYNKGGIYRYVDYVSQLPEFLRAEDDVVVFLQVLSDYINNAYRNITVVEQFKFSFVCVDSNYTSVQNKVTNLVKLFKNAETRDQKMLYLSKPEGNKYTNTRPFIVDYINYSGNYEDNQLPVDVLSSISSVQTGDKVYVKFLKDIYAKYSGVFIYENNKLIPDPNATSQDPFTNTQNEPFITSLGLVPRILQFNVKDISTVRIRPSKTVNDIVFYDVFFHATIYNIESINSIDEIEFDIDGDGVKDKILIDYYNTIKTLSSTYEEHLFLKFSDTNNSFDWNSGYGRGLFYAREMTKEQAQRTKNNTVVKETFVDPIYSLTSDEMAIQKIYSDGSSITVIVTGTHSFVIGDSIYITHTSTFNGKYDVIDIVSSNTFKLNPLNTLAHYEVSGIVVASNLMYSKNINNFDSSNLKVIYKLDESTGIDTISKGDIFHRVEPSQYDDFETDVDCYNVDTVQNMLTVYDTTGFKHGDIVFIVYDAGSYIVGLNTNVPHVIQDIDKNRIMLYGVNFSATGTGTARLIKANHYVSTSNASTENYTLNDTTNIMFGDYVRVTALSSSALPIGFSESDTYVINAVDHDNKTVEISGIYPTALTTHFRIVVYAKNKTSYGVVDYQNIKQTTAELILNSYTGDMISDGYFVKLDSSLTPATVYVTGISTLWNSSAMYKTGSYVTYNNIRYRTLVDNKGNTPDKGNYFVVDMIELTAYNKKLEYNPYMFGMYNTQSVAYGQSIDYTTGVGSLGSSLFIQKEQDFALRYGAYQREFIYNPRFASSYKVARNGYMEIIESNNAHDAVMGDISKHIDAKTQESMMLYGSTIHTTFNIEKISKAGGVVTVVLDQKHGYVSGIHITIVGITETEYNGNHSIKVLSPNAFTYIIDDITIGVGTTTSTSRVSYSNDIKCVVEQISSVDNIATVTTVTVHGYNIGTKVTIDGCNESYYNVIGKDILHVDDYTFTYEISGNHTGNATGTSIHSTYEPVVGNYVNVCSQLIPSQNGIYTVSDTAWTLYDQSKVSVPFTFFTRLNMFGSDTINNTIATDDAVYTVQSLTRISHTVTALLYAPHTYVAGDTVTISGAMDSAYNGTYIIDTVPNVPYPLSFTYKIKTLATPTTPAIPSNKNGITVVLQKWYKYEVSEIEWQQKSNFNIANAGNAITNLVASYSLTTLSSIITVHTYNPHGYIVGQNISIKGTVNNTLINTYIVSEVITPNIFVVTSSSILNGTEITGYTYSGTIIDSNGNNDNIATLAGEYSYTTSANKVIKFMAGDIIELNDQFIPSENGTYRVMKNTIWKRLDKRLVMKIRNIAIDSYENVDIDPLADTPIPYIYRTYTDTEVNNYIDANFKVDHQVYKTDLYYILNFDFRYEIVNNIDTTALSYSDVTYDSKYDYNSISPRNEMKSDFIGVPDMTYPLVEKFNRLMYLKDPKVIDFSMIEYLARMMGYDISELKEDIDESVVYKTDEQRENAVRETIQNLPQYYALKGTKSSLEMMMLAFGIVGEVINKWTKQSNPYDELIPDYELKGAQLTENLAKTGETFVSTPHFAISIELESNSNNQLMSNDTRRIVSQVNRMKPINTVFDGIYNFLSTKAYVGMSMSNMRSVARMTSAVGYENLDFSDPIVNTDCFDNSFWHVSGIINMYLSNSSVMDSMPTGSFVGNIIGLDQYLQPMIYTLPVGVDSNQWFTISGNRLLTNYTFPSTTQCPITILATTSTGITYSKQFIITVIPFVASPLILEITSTSPNQTMSVFNMVGTNKTVDWGDGTIETISNTSFSHVYVSVGVYTLKMNGNYVQYADGTYDHYKLTETGELVTALVSWGNQQYGSLANMFSGCYYMTSIPSSWDALSNVTSIYELFYSCGSLESIPSTWAGLSSVTNARYAFRGCSSLTSIPSSWEGLGNVTTVDSMFEVCTSLTQIPDSWVGLNSLTETPFMFYFCTSLTTIPITWHGLETITNSEYMFSTCTSLSSIPSSWSELTSLVIATGMFTQCSSLTSIPTTWLSIPSALRDMYSMFSDCGLTAIPTTWQGLENITDLQYTFNRTKITSIPTTWTGLQNIISLVSTFSGTLISSIPTSWSGLELIQNAQNVFSGCNNLTSIPSSWAGLTSLTFAYGMFSACNSLTTIPTSWAGLEGVTNTTCMFQSCNSLTSIPSSWNGLGSVLTMEQMFYLSTSLHSIPTDWSGLSSLTNMTRAFSGCTALTTIGTVNYTALSKVTNVDGLFDGCTALTSNILNLYTYLSTKAIVINNHYHTFTNCTSAAGYASISASWGGGA